MKRLATMGALVVVLAGCGSKHGVSIVVSPTRSAEYQPIAIHVSGLAPREVATLLVTSTDAEGRHFESAITYRADAQGRLDPASAQPTDGQYSGTWPMGPLTLMIGPPGANPFYDFGSTPRPFVMSVRAKGKVIAHATFERALSLEPLSIRSLTVARDGFEGFFTAPRGARRLPAVLEFGGSEGGPSAPATGLASTGLAVLSVGYFHAPGLPNELKDIPLEYFKRALQWLERRPQVDPKRVTVAGTSRGSEAALLLGVHYPSLVHGVAAFATSNVSLCGIAGAQRGGGCIGPAWTLEGKPVPYTEQYDDPHPTENPAAVIPVERIRGPVLVTCGTNDQIWSSCPYAHAIVSRLRAHRFAYPYRLYRYAGVGHSGSQLGRYWPGGITFDTFQPGDERAREALWPHAIAFFKGGAP